MLISEDYREQNRILHETRADYGSKVKPERISRVRDWRDQIKAKSILDYGCGKGVLAKNLPRVANYDPAIPAFAAPPMKADLVVCIDVLEHIEPECLDAVLDDLRRLGEMGAFLIIGTRFDSSKTLPDGRNPHLIVEPAEWWLPKLRARWRIASGWFTEGELGARCLPL